MDKPIPEAVLLPCPMCGSDAALNTCRTTESEFIRLNGRDTGYGVNCVDCGLNNRGFAYGYATAAEASAAWNRRSALTAAQQQGGGDLGEVVCLACGDHIMPMGQVCHACSHPVSAPPSAPVGVEAMVREAVAEWEKCKSPLFAQRGMFKITNGLRANEAQRTLAQQPAAVNEAWQVQLADALECFWNAAIDGSGRDRDNIIGGMVQGFAAVATRLREHATQHQEPTTCKHDFRRDEDHGGACCQLCGEVRQ